MTTVSYPTWVFNRDKTKIELVCVSLFFSLSLSRSRNNTSVESNNHNELLKEKHSKKIHFMLEHDEKKTKNMFFFFFFFAKNIDKTQDCATWFFISDQSIDGQTN